MFYSYHLFGCLMQVFVGNLDPNIPEEELKQTFLQFGDIVYVKIIVGKGCGFVQFGTRFVLYLVFKLSLDCPYDYNTTMQMPHPPTLFLYTRTHMCVCVYIYILYINMLAELECWFIRLGLVTVNPLLRQRKLDKYKKNERRP